MARIHGPANGVIQVSIDRFRSQSGFPDHRTTHAAGELTELRAEWWNQINHHDKTAIYPPLLQLGFRGLAATLGAARARGMVLLPWLVDPVRRPAEVSNTWIP